MGVSPLTCHVPALPHTQKVLQELSAQRDAREVVNTYKMLPLAFRSKAAPYKERRKNFQKKLNGGEWSPPPLRTCAPVLCPLCPEIHKPADAIKRIQLATHRDWSEEDTKANPSASHRVEVSPAEYDLGGVRFKTLQECIFALKNDEALQESAERVS